MKHFRYVKYSDVPMRMKQGWLVHSDFVDTHHGEYVCLMVWLCECDPP